MLDVVIVGAGPAGCAAAITARRAGLSVAVLDRAGFPRDKICGDGLTTSALRELEALGLDPSGLPSWFVVDAAVVRSPSGEEVTLPMPVDGGIHAAVARRAELDIALVDLARAAGATVLERHTVTGVHTGADHVTITTEKDGTFIARHVVAADGMWSPVRRLLGLDQPG